MKAKVLIAVVGTLVLVIMVLAIKSRSGEPRKVYGDDAPNVYKYVEAESDKYRIRTNFDIGFVEVIYVDMDSGESYLAYNVPSDENQAQIVGKAASLYELVKGGTGEYVLRLTLKQQGDHLYYLLGIDLFEGQSEHRVPFEDRS